MIRQAIVFLGLVLGSSHTSHSADGSMQILVSASGRTETQREVSVAAIEKAGLHEIEAFNPYEKRSDTYTGVWMQDFVAAFGTVDTSTLITRAIDDYEITFGKEEWQNLRILIATRVNGEYIDFDGKGPMRIIFPDFDENLEAHRINLPKWTWMITEIAME
ncbi:hypothetical protein [Roseibium sp. Sym1]|uniref:hypothetical protein n=1 Tax=Roseibium sp. Sym1 TaxID=3016006 RepID=UPI0022B2D9CA|nr:hypothetical protein [Roseibium sp. Sym1]